MKNQITKCDNCGGMMKQMDAHTMQCESCGTTIRVDVDAPQEKAETNEI